MKHNLDLQNTPVPKLFLNYLIPTVTGMLVMSLHIVIDGIFVGRGVGSDGLAAVNIAVPLFSFFIATGLLIGLGGATVVAIKFGEGNDEEACSIFTQSIVLIVIAVLIVMFLCQINLEKLAYALGANDRILFQVEGYMKNLLYFGLVYGLADALSCFVRNDGAPLLSMICMVVGAVINCALDYVFIFIFNWGVEGAALATGIGNTISTIILLMHFILKRGKLKFIKTSFNFSEIKRVLKVGFPSFLTEISMAVIICAHNLVLISITGELGVSAYSIISYINTLIILIFLGIAQAVQPIISFNLGAGEYKRVQESFKLAVRTAVIVGICSLFIGLLWGENMVKMFIENNTELIALATEGIKLYFINYLFMGFNIVVATYFQAIEKPKFSNIVTVCRGLLFVVAALLILPKLLNVNGVWLAVPTAELLTTLVSVFLLKSVPIVKELNVDNSVKISI